MHSEQPALLSGGLYSAPEAAGEMLESEVPMAKPVQSVHLTSSGLYVRAFPSP